MVHELVERLRRRAEIRRQIPTRKSVQEGKPDRLSDLLEEAAMKLEEQERDLCRKNIEIWGLNLMLEQNKEK